jgi:capsular exopolysaccharide synthesis family protein
MLRANVEFAKADTLTKSLCVMSAGAGEGKSFSCGNLAFVYAQHGAKVLVVDGDLRRPSVHQYFGLPNNVGLADHLAGTKKIDDIIQPSNIPNISVITSGTGLKSALPMLTSERMAQLIREVSQRFDIVLYDTPPVLGVSDAAIIVREVGTGILVVQHRRYPRTMSMRARQIVENAGGKLLGVIVNNVNVGQDESYYYYHDHYDRYMQVPETMAPAATTVAKKTSSDEIELQDKY